MEKEVTVKDVVGDKYSIGEDGKTIARDKSTESHYQGAKVIEEEVHSLSVKNDELRRQQEGDAMEMSECFDDTLTKVEVMPFNQDAAGVISPRIIVAAVVFLVLVGIVIFTVFYLTASYSTGA